MKPKSKETVELHMNSEEFDRLMRGALAVEPPRKKQHTPMRRSNQTKRKKR